jgi:endonuclease III-like uncharacterized protein
VTTFINEATMNDREVLLQEIYIKGPCGPWRVLVTCMTLNQTTWVQAQPALEAIFKRWPTPSCFLGMRPDEVDDLRAILQPLGFMDQRARRLVTMSQQFSMKIREYQDSWEKYEVLWFTGCGQYALDAWSLFVLRRPCAPSDKRLRWYAEKNGLLT